MPARARGRAGARLPCRPRPTRRGVDERAGRAFGRVPARALAACGLPSPSAPNWWLAWRRHVFYARGVQPVDARGSHRGAPRDFAVLVAGAALGANRMRPGASADPRSGSSGRTTRSRGSMPSAACPGDAATRALRRRRLRSRGARACAIATRNDVVVALAVTRGFTLLELLMVLLVVADPRRGARRCRSRRRCRCAATRRRGALLDEAREALLGFAAAHGRLPCPASAASRGEEASRPAAMRRTGAARILRRVPSRRGPRAGAARRRGLPARRVGHDGAPHTLRGLRRRRGDERHRRSAHARQRPAGGDAAGARRGRRTSC